jgi:N-methylhydantoinase A/oxoprolinase/acetone carboxylase beta subunit
MYRAGIDIGGTFTDTVMVDGATGQVTFGKVSTTPRDPSLGAISGVTTLTEELQLAPNDLESLVHATTLVSNALIERTGALTGLMCTRGFRDVLESRNEKRYDLYDMNSPLPLPLVPRRLRFEIDERMDEHGNVVVPLDTIQAEAAIMRLLAGGVDSIAVCFLHSFQNPQHELAVREIIRRIAPGIYVSLSVEVAPQIREWPRTSTTCINAYVQPLMEKYLSGFEDKLRNVGFDQTVYMMVSGGVTTSSHAKAIPVRVAESGPAAGAMAAAYFGSRAGISKVMSFDMGGTTAKICFVEDGNPARTTDFEVAREHRFRRGSGLPIAIQAVDMIEIGAGGGSIARINAMGLLKVGPESAAADPGPACYGRGGKEPTVTDANLALGYFDPDFFLGGQMPLDLEASRRTIHDRVAKPLGLSLLDAAFGIHQLVNENMANAARVHSAEKGKDQRSYTLIGFGGAGPSHACAIAEKLSIAETMIPRGAGVASALGMLSSPFAFDFTRSYMSPLGSLDLVRLNAMLAEIQDQGVALLGVAGVEVGRMTVVRACDMRYRGQVHQITIPIPEGELGPNEIQEIGATYDAEYERLYRRRNAGYSVECISWHVRVQGPPPILKLPEITPAKSAGAARKGERPAYFGQRGSMTCGVYDRALLPADLVIEGPAFIEERETTALVPPGWRAKIDRQQNLRITAQDDGSHAS